MPIPDQLQRALDVLAVRLDIDDGAVLREAWTGRVEPVADDPAAVADRMLRDTCRSRGQADALGTALGERTADVVMVWAESLAGHRELMLAPVIVGASQAHEPYRSRAATARIAHGPLFDALHALPAAWGAHYDVRLRLRQLIWEAGARGLCFAELGRWLWRTPDAVEQLVFAPARGNPGERVLAARALASFADGFSEDTARAVARSVVDTAVALRDDPEAAVWGPAARALGRLSVGCTPARMTVFRATEARRLTTRRRNLVSIASIPLALGAESWIRERIQKTLATQDDPWAIAALAVATPHLARERPEIWEALCNVAIDTRSLEIKWSLAQGLAVLARHSAGHGWVTSEERVARALREHLVSNPPSTAHEIARHRDALLGLDRALGDPPSVRSCFDEFDARVRADIEGVVAPEPSIPRVAFDDALAAIRSTNENERGDALLAIRSASRAQAMHLPELVLGLRTLPADTEHMLAACTERLGAEAGDYALRSALAGVLADLVNADSSQRGRLAARSLRAIGTSEWAAQVVRDAADPARAGQARRDVQRFRKPLVDIFDAALAAIPGHESDGAAVPPALRTWWLLCLGSTAVLQLLERGDDRDGHDADAAFVAAIADAAAGAPVAKWGERAVRELDRSGAAGSALGATFVRLVRLLERIESQRDPHLVDELHAVCHALVASGNDLDNALAEVADGTEAPDWVLRGAKPVAGGDEPWKQLSPAMRRVVERAHSSLQRDAPLASRFEPRPGATFGNDYLLVEQIGRGGMGEVWRATWQGRPVAVKLPRLDLDVELHKQLADAIHAEAILLAPLSFARVATLLDHGVIGDVPYLTTSFIRGRTLEKHLIDDPVADPSGQHLPLARRVLGDICIGLDNLHMHGFVHRDLKPGNVMLRMRGRLEDPLQPIARDPRGHEIDEAVLIDFGIAHQLNLAGDRGATPGYAPPEAVRQEPVGPAADIYAFGAFVFHLMTGRLLCGDREPLPALVWHATTEPFADPDVVAAAAKLPLQIRQAIAGACRLNPRERIGLEELRSLVAPRAS